VVTDDHNGRVTRPPRAFLPALVVALLTALVGGCELVGVVGAPSGGPYPEACAQWSYSARRCEAIVDRARRTAHVAEADIQAISLLPFERAVGMGGGQVALVRFELATGAAVDQDVWCVGVGRGPACGEETRIWVLGGVDHDVPCAWEAPAGCATLPPTPPAVAVSAATPFRLASLDIPLDHEGRYEIPLGSATLPNGYLSERSFRLADDSPDSFWIDDGVLLEIRPEIAGRPPVGSIYRDPFDGPEPVTVFLVFEVTDLDSPSVLQIIDVVVR
jgi:hypothetical protein